MWKLLLKPINPFHETSGRSVYVVAGRHPSLLAILLRKKSALTHEQILLCTLAYFSKDMPPRAAGDTVALCWHIYQINTHLSSSKQAWISWRRGLIKWNVQGLNLFIHLFIQKSNNLGNLTLSTHLTMQPSTKSLNARGLACLLLFILFYFSQVLKLFLGLFYISPSAFK